MPEAAAGERSKASSEQVELDTEELRALEHNAYYADEPAAAPPTIGIIARLRALVGRGSSSSGQGE